MSKKRERERKEARRAIEAARQKAAARRERKKQHLSKAVEIFEQSVRQNSRNEMLPPIANNGLDRVIETPFTDTADPDQQPHPSDFRFKKDREKYS